MRDPEVRKAVLRDLDHYVIKPTGASGGYGVVIGPKATDEELEQARQRIEAAPDGFIAQPVFPLSVHPTLSGGAVRRAKPRWWRATSICGPSCCSEQSRGCWPEG